MALNKGIPTTPVEHLFLLGLCKKKNEMAETPAEYKFLPHEKDALEAALDEVEARYKDWITRSDEYGLFVAQWRTLEKQARDLIGRARSFWRMRFEEGNTYERTAGIDNTPRKKTRLSQALADIVEVSDDNAGTLAELPSALKDAISDLHDKTAENLEKTEEAMSEKKDSYQELKKAIKEKGLPALKACREYLYSILPDGKRDQLLGAWGFEPWDEIVHHKPAEQRIDQKSYDPETDIVIIRGTEDILASEYILEFGRTQSPAPTGSTGSPTEWTPAEWEVFMTSDEPYFETEALTEGFTYAFRIRAKNSAGYGKNSEIWIVEVV